MQYEEIFAEAQSIIAEQEERKTVKEVRFAGSIAPARLESKAESLSDDDEDSISLNQISLYEIRQPRD